MRRHTSDVVGEYLTWCAAGDLSPKTLSAYAWALAYLPDWLPCDATELNRTIGLVDLATESKHNLIRVWTTFFRWAGERHAIGNPMAHVRRPKRRRKLPRVFTDIEIRSIWSVCRSQRDQALIAILLDTGIRLGELAGLTWDQVEQRYIHVDGKSGPRSVPVSVQAQQLLVGLGDIEHVWVGRVGPMTYDGIKITIRKILARAGIRGRKLGAHTFRHTFATNYLRAGGNVFALQRILGHSSISVTQLYVHLVRDDLAECHEEYSPLRLVWFNDPDVEETAK